MTATSTPTPSPSPPATETPHPDPLVISELVLNDIDNTRLSQLSVSEHPYFGGYTRVHGTLAISGTGNLTDVLLDVIESNAVVTTAGLTPTARDILIQPFGDDGLIAITESTLLFEIPSVELSRIDQTSDGLVSLRVRAQSSSGADAVSSEWPVQKLVRYTKANRYFVGEEAQGGNDWVRPSVRAYVEQLDSVLAGDFSNMNGGPFPPHFSHQTGKDIDLWFEGYNSLDTAAAQRLLAIVNQPAHVARIQNIFVAYERVAGNPFWEVLNGVVLADGRPAASVIVPDPGHYDHFHLRVYY
ncbi:MAG TPA: penicillin-insensitive murein endopeptidase [Thermomicrobiales bacterium]|nr:penicillin-insensitive murein endopeptidase [Thermomicrobiales bacterium]